MLAILLKPFSSLLSSPFQYFGVWLLLCFCLQSWFSWKLIGLITNNVASRLLGAGLFVFAPPMIFRLHGHYSLVGHFLIVAALYLALNPKLVKRRFAWGALLASAALVHAYFLAMIALIWIANLCGKMIRKEISVRSSAFEFSALFAVVCLVCWQAGYFSIGNGVSVGGFGYYRLNLSSIFDSSHWSYVLKDLPEAGGDAEGFNYLGLGVIFLLALSAPVLLSGEVGIDRIVGRHLYLLIGLVGLAVFAVSNKVGLGLLETGYSLPAFVINLAGIFRASGRMFWPVFYVIVLVVIFVVVRGYSKRTTAVVLGLALIIQVVDTSAGWLPIRNKLMTKPMSEWRSALTDPFWAEAATKYKNLRYIPVKTTYKPMWLSLAYFAASNGLATDMVNLARKDTTC